MWGLKTTMIKYFSMKRLYLRKSRSQADGIDKHVLEPYRDHSYPCTFLGGPKSILSSLFWNKKASFKGIYTLNGVHMWVFFNTERLNMRATHFNQLS